MSLCSLVAVVTSESSVGINHNGPESYGFFYDVKEGGNDFGHQETRIGDRTTGEYRTLLPDGRVQIVSYTADEDGYKADVSYVDKKDAEAIPPKNDLNLLTNEIESPKIPKHKTFPKSIPISRPTLPSNFVSSPSPHRQLPNAHGFPPLPIQPFRRPFHQPMPLSSPFKPISVPFGSIPPPIPPSPFSPDQQISNQFLPNSGQIPSIIPPSPFGQAGQPFQSPPGNYDGASPIPFLPAPLPFKRTNQHFSPSPQIPYKPKPLRPAHIPNRKAKIPHLKEKDSSDEDNSVKQNTNAHSLIPSKKHSFYKPMYLVTRDPHNYLNPYGLPPSELKHNPYYSRHQLHPHHRLRPHPKPSHHHRRNDINEFSKKRSPVLLKDLMHKFYHPTPNPFYRSKHRIKDLIRVSRFSEDEYDESSEMEGSEED